MIVNTTNIQEGQDPPVNVKKAADWIMSLYKDGGAAIDRKTAESYASNKNFKSMIPKLYIWSGNQKNTPKDKGLELYNSFLDTNLLEKKKEKTVGDSALDYISSEQDSVSLPNIPDSSKQEVEIPENIKKDPSGFKKLDWSQIVSDRGVYLNYDFTYDKAISSMPIDVFKMEEDDAIQTLSAIYSDYGFKFDKSSGYLGIGDFVDKITITNPEGETRDFRLFTEAYTSSLEKTTNINTDDLLKKRVDDLKSFMGTSKINALDLQKNNFSEATFETLPFKLNAFMNNQRSVSNESQEFLMRFSQMNNMEKDSSVKDYMVKGLFDYKTFESDLKDMQAFLQKTKSKLNVPYSVDDEQKKVFEIDMLKSPIKDKNIFTEDDIIYLADVIGKDSREISMLDLEILYANTVREYEDNKQKASTNAGNLLRKSGAYKSIDYNNPLYLQALALTGLKPEDIPLKGLYINGKSSSLNDAVSILYDFDAVQAVRDGRINIEIDTDKDNGILQPLLIQAKNIRKKQEAYANLKIGGYLGEIIDSGRTIFEMGENILQQGALSLMELVVNAGHAWVDTMKALPGMDPKLVDLMYYGQEGLPSASVLSMFNPENFDKIKEEWIPQWDGDILDSKSLNEFLNKSIEPITKSMVTSGAFLLNPYFGLTTLGVQSYGSNLRAYDKQIKAVKEKQERGVVLSPEELNILTTSDIEKRLLSLGKAGLETGLTSLFTLKFYKNISSAVMKGMPKEKTQVFAEQYAKTFRNKFAYDLAKVAGVNVDLYLRELPEELLIAFTTYLVDVAAGHKKFDRNEAYRLLGETALITTMSTRLNSTLISSINNKRVRNLGDGIIYDNIKFEGEDLLTMNKLKTDGDLKVLEDEAEAKNETLDNNEEYKLLKKQQIDYDTQLDKIIQHKKSMLANMSDGDRIAFINYLADIKRKEDVISDITKPIESRKIAADEIKKIKEDALLMLSQYPSEGSYFFASEDVQSNYLNESVKILTQQSKQKGTNKTFNTEDDVVVEKASQLYLEDLRNKRIESNEIAYVFPGRGLGFDPNAIVINVSDDDIDKFDLNQQLDFEKGFLEYFEILTSKKTPSDKTKEKFENLDEDNLERNLNEFSEALDQLIEDNENLQESVYLNDLKKIKNSTDEDLVRRGQLMLKIKEMNNLNNLYNSLSKNHKAILADYFFDIRLGKRPKFGLVEDMLDAHDIAIKMSAMQPGEIDLTVTGKENAALLEKLFARYVNWTQGVYAGKGVLGYGKNIDLVTVDVLKQMTFRDKRTGELFFNLVDQGLQKAAGAKQYGNQALANALIAYVNDVKAYNKTGKTIVPGVSKKGFVKGDMDPNSIQNSYELNILGSLYRKVRKDADEDIIPEFDRMKGLILQELENRKIKYENTNTNKKVYKNSYEQWKKTVERLDIKNAKSFEDVASKAFPFNVNAVKRMADEFSKLHDGVEARITDYNRSDPFLYARGEYVPIFMKTTNNQTGFSDYLGQTKALGSTESHNLQDTTRPVTFKEGISLSPGMYFENVYSSLTGSKLEIDAYKYYNTLDNLLNNEVFTSMFAKNQQTELILNAWKKRRDYFDKEVRSTNLTPVDIESAAFKGKTDQFMNTALGAISSVSLTRLTQSLSQYVSASVSAYPLLRNSRAKEYMLLKGAGHLMNSGALAAGTKPSARVNRFLSGGELSNIYSKSRTGFRNSKLSELALERNSKRDFSWYASAFGVDVNSPAYKQFLSKEGIQATTRYNYDQFLNKINKMTEGTLDIFLANSDRNAAMNAFEAHYMDYKLSNGEKIPSDLSKWWQNENANPDLDAIRHADNIVGRTMRQTDRLSEADIFQPDQSEDVKNFMRIVFPFHKFIINAKSDLSNQYAILLDESVPEEQKEFARAVIQGRMQEIGTFNAIKYVGKIGIVKGIAGLMSLGLEDEDIERLGGLDYLAQTQLPIATKNESFNAKDWTVDQAENLEEYNRIMAGLNEIDDVTRKINNSQSFTFDNKAVLKDIYAPTKAAGQDIVLTMQPGLFGDTIEDLSLVLLNKVLGTNTMEFISSDLEGANTPEGVLMLLVKNAGLAGIAFNQSKALFRAFTLAKSNRIIKYGGEFGTGRSYYLTAPNEKIAKKVKDATIQLLSLRLAALGAPGAPRAEIDQYADALERGIDTYFAKKTEPDEMFNNTPSTVGEYMQSIFSSITPNTVPDGPKSFRESVIENFDQEEEMNKEKSLDSLNR